MKHKRLSKKEEEKRKQKARLTSIQEGSAWALSSGFGYSYITPFALVLGASNTHIGFLQSIPNLVGSVSQLFTQRVMRRTTRKSLVMHGAGLQALTWLVLIAIGALFFFTGIDSGVAPILLVIAYTFLVLSASFTVPAWESWMKDIVERNFGIYFGTRNRIIGAIALISMLLAGFILDFFKPIHVFIGFSILFFVAFVGRAISTFLFTKIYEPDYKMKDDMHDHFGAFVEHMTKSNFGKFTLFITLFTASHAIAGPFFAVYMLKNLGFSYITFTVVSIASAIASLLFLSAWGKFADNYGNKKVLTICGFSIPALPFLWLLTPMLVDTNFLVPMIFGINFLSGLLWGGFGLASFNFIFDSIPTERFIPIAANFNVINGVGLFVGATIGGILSSLDFVVIGLSSILFIFFLSGVMRFLVSAIFLTRIKEVRKVKRLTLKQAEHALLHISPHRIVHWLK